MGMSDQKIDGTRLTLKNELVLLVPVFYFYIFFASLPPNNLFLLCTHKHGHGLCYGLPPITFSQLLLNLQFNFKCTREEKQNIFSECLNI